MHRKELIREVALSSERIQMDTAAAVSAVFDVIKETLVRGEVVDIPYFGRFEVKIRNGVKSPAFVPHKDLKLIIKYDL